MEKDRSALVDVLDDFDDLSSSASVARYDVMSDEWYRFVISFSFLKYFSSYIFLGLCEQV